MRKILSVLTLCCALMAGGLDAHAAGGGAGSGLFPTDILKQGKVAASVGYRYSYESDSGSRYATGAGIGTYNFAAQSQSLSMGVDAGAGYGIQVGIRTDAELGGYISSHGYGGVGAGAVDSTSRYSGWRSPSLLVKMSPLQALKMDTSVFDTVVEYGYRPGRWGSDKNQTVLLGRDYGWDTHTASIIGSVAAGQDVKIYLGWTGDFRADNTYGAAAKMGNTQYMKIGARYAFSDRMAAQIDTNVGFWNNIGAYANSFVTSEMAVKGEVNVIGGLWVVPAVGYKWTGEADRTTTAGTLWHTQGERHGFTGGIDFRYNF